MYHELKRNDGLDLLRLVAMFLIVLHHCAFWGNYRLIDGIGMTWGVLLAFTLLTQWHVDSFVGISGWFGIKFSWRKFIKLWGVLAFYSFLSCAYIFYHAPSNLSLGAFAVRGGWFAGAYLILMMLSPLLNKAVQCCGDSLCELKRIVLPLTVAIILNWAPFNCFSGVASSSCDGFSVLNMVWIYIAAMTMRKFVDAGANRKIAVMLYFFGGGALLIESFLVLRVCFRTEETEGMLFVFNALFKYNAPYTWLVALSVVYLFSRLKVSSELACRCIRFITPSVFGIYLFHETTAFGHPLICGVQRLLQINISNNQYVVIVASAIVIYVTGLAVDLFRRMMLCSLKVIFKRVLPFARVNRSRSM